MRAFPARTSLHTSQSFLPPEEGQSTASAFRWAGSDAKKRRAVAASEKRTSVRHGRSNAAR
ncbi:hypothetical protein [uncultured Fretibacterium sp.]|uniref:hypothetical protein n=1 Tax=uncultured Fretibacterium sp. TaxID=1678694 RepID=UPI00262C8B7C|nr:hypothetical protein [uncultured Fretibacterium sp.]